jgi:hypothetical protein
MMIPSAATGRLRKKIARQLTCSVSSPPTTGPIASASAETPAHVPIARPRSAGGKALVTIESVAGIMKAAPIPCTARLITSQASFGAKPAVADESANTLTPKKKARRRPKMSPRRPAVTSSTAIASVYALIVHSSAESDAPRSSWIEGSATFTTVLSSMIMKSEKLIAASVHHLRFCSVIARRRATSEPSAGGSG